MKSKSKKESITLMIYTCKKFCYERINFLIILVVAVVISAIFYIANVSLNNILVNFISKNLWCQTIIMFLTLASFINIFYPFTLRKEYKKKDIEGISEKQIKKERDRLKYEEFVRKHIMINKGK